MTSFDRQLPSTDSATIDTSLDNLPLDAFPDAQLESMETSTSVLMPPPQTPPPHPVVSAVSHDVSLVISQDSSTASAPPPSADVTAESLSDDIHLIVTDRHRLSLNYYENFTFNDKNYHSLFGLFIHIAFCFNFPKLIKSTEVEIFYANDRNQMLEKINQTLLCPQWLRIRKFITQELLRQLCLHNPSAEAELQKAKHFAYVRYSQSDHYYDCSLKLSRFNTDWCEISNFPDATIMDCVLQSNMTFSLLEIQKSRYLIFSPF